MLNLFCHLLLMANFNTTHPTDTVGIAYAVSTVSEMIPASLVYSIIATESGFDSNALSPAEAKGLMQLTPIAIQDITNRINVLWTRRTAGDSFDSEQEVFFRHCKMIKKDIDLFDIYSNITAGVCYLHLLSTRYDTIVELLAAYNGGHRQVMNLASGKPLHPETANYIPKVLHYQSTYTKKECK